MKDGPFQDLVPAPDLVQGGTLLAAGGEYYLLRVKNFVRNQHIEIQLKEGAQYRVDLIDPWLMKIYELGNTGGGLQAFDLPITPSLLRFKLILARKSKDEAPPLQTLIATFLKDPSIAEPPKAVPIQHPAPSYSAECTIGELLDSPKTRALVEKYLPNLPSVFYIRALTVENLMNFPNSSSIGDLWGLAQELAKTPVGP